MPKDNTIDHDRAKKYASERCSPDCGCYVHNLARAYLDSCVENEWLKAELEKMRPVYNEAMAYDEALRKFQAICSSSFSSIFTSFRSKACE